LHLLAHPLPEARHYGRMILRAVQDVMPSFVSRVERPDRGGEWVAYLERRERAAERWAARLGLDRAPGDDGAGGPSVRLTHHDGDEDLLLSALLFEATATDERATRAALDELSDQDRGALLAARHDRRAAMYALCLGYRLRYVLDLNAREAMQLIELRSGREGHPSYRAVAHAMHERIAAVHPAVAAAMTHIDRETEPRLERIVSELRTQAKLDAR
jgi:thymidylate synthase ThyX